jgi:5'-deoxynucleotidase YfbR-like HD superfamily hydrolase
MNPKIKFIEIVLSDLISHRDTLELELNRIINETEKSIVHKKIDFDKLLGDIVENNNKIQLLSEYLGSLKTEENNNED